MAKSQKKNNNNAQNYMHHNNETQHHHNNKKNEDETKATKVVLKVDMHCEGCSNKIVKFIKGFQALNLLLEGFENLDIEKGTGNLIVNGTVDAGKLRDQFATKTKKKVDLISPVLKKKDENKSENENKNKQDDKKSKEPPVTTTILKLELHCQGCIEKIRKTVSKAKGVYQVTIDKEKEIVIVKGTMDVKMLVEKLKKRFKRKVEVVPTKKEKENEKGENEGGNKKNNQKGEGGGGGGKKKGEGNVGDNMAKREVLIHAYGHGYDYGYGGVFGFDQGYNYGQVQMMQAPQMFSDENPNACSVM